MDSWISTLHCNSWQWQDNGFRCNWSEWILPILPLEWDDPQQCPVRPSKWSITFGLPCNPTQWVVCFWVQTGRKTECCFLANCEHENTAQFCRHIFHKCLRRILKPLQVAMEIPELVLYGDGYYWNTVYSIGPYIADYLEQVLLSCMVCSVFRFISFLFKYWLY